MNLATGYVVEFSAKGSQPGFAAVLSHAGGNVRLFLPNGKETTIPDKKVLHATTRAVVNPADREACKALLAEIDNRRRQLAEEIDLAEIHELLAEEERSFSLQDIAGYLYSDDEEDQIAALLRCLSEDKLYFRSKNECYTPLKEEEMLQIRQQIEKKQAQEAEELALVEDLKAAAAKKVLSEELQKRLNDLKMFVACGTDAPINKRLISALERAGLANQRKLMATLVACNAVDADENLLLIKYRVPIEFSSELRAVASEITGKNMSEVGHRLDLRQLKTWAIDTPGSKDRDDAFSFEQTDEGETTLYVHIADPAEFILPDSELDREAARRGSSIYMPDGRIHMLPEEISENFLSLSENGVRYAISFILHFDTELKLKNFKVAESIVTIDVATCYDSADALLNQDEWLRRALAFAESLKNIRAENGAAMFPRQPELEVKVVAGEIQVSHRSRDDQTAGMIAEFMIWANHAAAEWCRSKSIPCLYRIQEPADLPLEFSETFDPVSFFAAVKTFKKTIVSPNAGRHSSLGLSAYTQVTSPLRRYADLLLHRQIKAALNKTDLPYDQSELNQAMMIADEAISRADEIMREREKYFLLKYLKLRQKTETLIFEGVVVDQSMNDVTFYVDFLCSFKHCRKPGFTVATGQKVGVKVNQIDLFDGIIRFDLVPES
jgi:exoribonuclease-2